MIEERLDAAIRIGTLAELQRDRDAARSLRRVVVASPAYLARRGAPQRLDDVAAHDVVVFGGLGRWDFGDGAVRVVTPRLTVSTAEAAIDAVVAGLGLTRVLSYQAVDAFARGALVQRARAHTAATRFRSICSIRAARIRRRSCAPSSILRCRNCARGSGRSTRMLRDPLTADQLLARSLCGTSR